MHFQKIFPLLISPLPVYLEVINRCWKFDAHFLVPVTITCKCDATLDYSKRLVHLCEEMEKRTVSQETEYVAWLLPYFYTSYSTGTSKIILTAKYFKVHSCVCVYGIVRTYALGQL
jgi:hypothetical protein